MFLKDIIEFLYLSFHMYIPLFAHENVKGSHIFPYILQSQYVSENPNQSLVFWLRIVLSERKKLLGIFRGKELSSASQYVGSYLKLWSPTFAL